MNERAPVYMKKQLEMVAIEHLAERAAVVWHVGRELQLSSPISDSALGQHWWGAWADGSDHIDVEVQSVLIDKNDAFQPGQLPTLRRLMDSQLFDAPIKQASSQADAIAVDEFNLLLKQLKYDITVFENWSTKCANAQLSRGFAKQEHRLEQRRCCAEAAKNFMAGCVVMTTWTSSETAISDILNFKRDVIAKKLGVVSHKIPTLVFLNWAAPCMIPVVVQENQLNVLSWALADNMQSCAFTIYPTFSYMKGKLHLEETKVTAALTRGNHNIDLQVSILFKDQTDVRDHRPMVYPARLVFPSPLGDPCKSLWYASDLRKNRRTPEIKQISGKSMKEIEDLSVDALPPTTYARDQRSFGGAKYSQLGAPAWDSILSSFFEGPSFTDVPAVLILDLYPRVGEMLEAFCKKRMLFTCSSLFYLGICEDATEQEWVRETMQETLAGQYEDGTLSLSGKPQKDINEDLLEPIPVIPKMNLLVVGGPGKDELHMPASIVKTWQFHDTFGREFVAFLDNFVLKHKVVDDALPGPAGKRPGSSVVDPEPSPKKLKLEPRFIVESMKITEALLIEVKMMPSKDAMFLQIRAGHQIYITNKAPHAVDVPPDSFVAAFGKGSFKLIKAGEEVAENIEFKLQNQDSLVVLNGLVVSVGKVVEEQRVKKPDCEICYHSITQDDQNMKKFELAQTHRIAFAYKPEGEAVEVSQANVAAKEILATWNSGLLQVLWLVRWSAKGLMPVKPVVQFRAAGVSLLAGRSVHCSE